MRIEPIHHTLTGVPAPEKTTLVGGTEERFHDLPRAVQVYVMGVVALYAATAAYLLPATRPAIDAALIAIFAPTALVRPVPNPLGGVSVPILGLITTEALLWRPAEVLVGVGVGAFLGLKVFRRSELWRAAINGAGWGLPAAASALVAHALLGGEPLLLRLGAAAVLVVATYRVTNTAIFTALRTLRSAGSFFADWPRDVAARWSSQLLSAPLAVALAAVAARLDAEWAALGLTALSVAVLPIPRQELAYYHRSRQTLEEIVEALVKALDRAEPGSRAHGGRVSALAVETGRRLSMRQDDLEALHLASRLHDVGLLAAPDRTNASHHATVGSQCLAQFPNPLIAETIRAHHQRWDRQDTSGGAQPAVPLGARILAAAELYDSARWGLKPYRHRWPVDDTLDHLRALAGNVLDPDVVATLCDVALEQELRGSVA
jgi:hypothetical protein